MIAHQVSEGMPGSRLKGLPDDLPGNALPLDDVVGDWSFATVQEVAYLREGKDLNLIFTASIAFVIIGLLDEIHNADPQPSVSVSEANHSVAESGRRYCDPPNMTALAAYYETNDEMNAYDYDFLQNQGATIENNISANDLGMLRKSLLSHWVLTLSFFPANYLSSKYGPGNVFGFAVLTVCCLSTATSELKGDSWSSITSFPLGVMCFTFYEMVFRFVLGGREILISFGAVKYVGVAICELLGLHQTPRLRTYTYYAAPIISIIWFILWSKTQFWSSKSICDNKRRKRNLRTPWRDILLSRPVWMTMFALFAADCGRACTTLVMRMYLKSVYELQVEKLTALSNLLHFAFAIACGFFFYYLIKSDILSVTTSRRAAVYLSHFLPAGVLFVLGFVGCGLVTPMILYCLGNVFTGANYSGVFSNPLDLAPTYVGPVLALCLTFGTLGSTFMYHLTLYILTDQTLVSWRFIFSLNSLILLVTAILFMLRGSGSPQPWNDPEHRDTRENKNVSEGEVSVAVAAPKPRTKSIYVVEKKILKVLHVQEPDKFTRVRAYSTSLPNERSAANQPNIYRPSNKKRASIS